MKFDEMACRRPGWTEGVWLKLGDGQAWCFPKVEFKMIARVTKSGKPDVVPEPYPPGFQYLVWLAIKEQKGPNPENTFAQKFDTWQLFMAATELLKSQYILPEDAWHKLLPFDPTMMDRSISYDDAIELAYEVLQVIIEPARRILTGLETFKMSGLEENEDGFPLGIN